MRCYLFSLQQQWVSGGSIDEFILLNMRQRAIEETGAPCLLVLYLDTLFSAYVHPPAFLAVSSTASAAEQLEYMLAPVKLYLATACDRCCLDQDRIVFVVSINRNHWVCNGLDMTDCAIVYLDSLGTSSNKVPLPAPRLCLCSWLTLSWLLQNPTTDKLKLENVKTWLQNEMSYARHADCSHAALKPACEWAILMTVVSLR